MGLRAVCSVFVSHGFLYNSNSGRLLSAWILSLSIYVFLLTNGRPQAIGSAICPGIAFLVKQTFLAAPIAIISWLIYRRRYKEAVVWATGFASTVVGGYGIAWWREPLIMKHIAALDSPLFEFRFAQVIILTAVYHAVVPFAAVGGFSILWQRAPEKLLSRHLLRYHGLWRCSLLRKRVEALTIFGNRSLPRRCWLGQDCTNFSARQITLHTHQSSALCTHFVVFFADAVRGALLFSGSL